MSERQYIDGSIARRKQRILGLTVVVLLIALVLSNAAWFLLEQHRQSVDRTVIFQVRYAFSHTAYVINQFVYVDQNREPTRFSWPNMSADAWSLTRFNTSPSASGWSPAGDGGYYEWHMTIPASTKTIRCEFNIAFLPTATENAWGTTLDSGPINLQDMPSEGTVYHVVLLLFY